MNQLNATQARGDWVRARRQALWEAIVDVFAHRSGALLPLDEVRSRLNVRGSHYRGLQHVPLEKIIGSEGRYADFDRRFLPLTQHGADRWINIDKAQMADVSLPPVELYKIGDIYFVKDGNHRISVARQNGQIDIDAYVTEYDVDVPLDPSVSMQNLLLKEEYSDFLDWTQLAQLRPEQRIELSELGGYLDLVNHINTHRYYMALDRNGPVSAEEAVISWYDNVYQPVAEAIRAHNILAHFPGRTEADLYLWIMQHRNTLREQAGEDPGAEVATLDYAARFGQPRTFLGAVSGAAHTVSNTVAQRLAEAARSANRRTGSPSLDLLDFMEWSHIDAVCPGTEIRFSDPHDYRRLRTVLEEHRQHLVDSLKREVSIQDAVADWCSQLYQPVVDVIHEQALLANWPHHTEADVYLAAMDHLRRSGPITRPEALTDAVVALKEQNNETERPLDTLIEGARRLLRRRR